MYNAAGELVRSLFTGSLQAQPSSLSLDHGLLLAGLDSVSLNLGDALYAGEGSLAWDGRGQGGAVVEGGVYYLKAEFIDSFGATNAVIREVQVLPSQSVGSLEVYNSAGELVYREQLPPAQALATDLRLGAGSEDGSVNVILKNGASESPWAWNGRNQQGALVASGNYTFKLVSTSTQGSRSVVSKDILLLRPPQSALPGGAVLPQSNPVRGGEPLALRWEVAPGYGVRARVYNAAGELVASAGAQGQDGSLGLGQGLASGIYLVGVDFLRGSALERRVRVKMAVLR